MKKFTLVLLALVLVLAMAGCGCEHEWEDATCDAPKTCKLCDETEGSPLGHEWAAATCEEPKTCEVCGETEGDALGHKWADATCDAPKTCETCGETEGDALGHSWEEATTEAPKTCTTCGATEGEKLIAEDERFTTAATKDIQGRWVSEVTFTGEMMGTTGLLDELQCLMIYEFGNTGKLSISVEMKDEAAFKEQMTSVMVDALYAEFEAQGLDKESADQAMVAAYGMTTEEYAASLVDGMGVADLLGEINAELVYYMEDGKLFTADSWSATFEETEYTLENGVLVFPDLIIEAGGDPLQFTLAEA